MKKDFQKYMYDKEVTPPENIWANIEQALDDRKRPKGLPYFMIVGSFVILGSIVGGLFWWNNSNETSNLPIVIEAPTSDSNNSSKNISQTESEAVSNSLEDTQIVDYDVNKAEQNIYSTFEDGKTISQNSNNNYRKPLSDKVLAKQSNSSVRNISIDDIDKRRTEINTLPSKETKLVEKNLPTNTDREMDNRDSTLVHSKIENLAEKEELIVDIDSISNTNETIANTNNLDDIKDANVQNDIIISKKKNVENRWELSSYIAPSYTRSMSKQDIWLIDLYEYKGRYAGSNNFGFHAAYNINPKWSVRSGIEINSLRQEGRNVAVTPQPIEGATDSDIFQFANLTIINSSILEGTYLDVSQIKFATVKQNIQYLSIPIDFGYSLYDSKILKMSAYLGASTHLLRRNSITLTTDTFTTEYGKATNLNKLIFGTQAGIQTRFKIGPDWGMVFEPRFLYYFNTFNDNNKVKPYTINFNAGLLFGF